MKYILDFKMEKIGDLLWIGGVAVKHAPPEFQIAWEKLRCAALHYLYGFTATREEQKSAANVLYDYAECLESAVVRKQVRSHWASCGGRNLYLC